MSLVCKTIYTNDKGACFYDTKFSKQDNNFFIPELNIYIDKISFNVFSNSDFKFFFAIKGKNNIYQLYPMNKDEYKSFSKNQKEFNISDPVSIGKGSYGEVLSYDNQKSVVKISKKNIKELEIPEDVIREISIYRLLKEVSCIPKLQGFQIYPSIEIQLEKGIKTLQNLLLGKEEIKEDIKKRIMLRLAKCLLLSSSQGIIHCDLKPENMIITESDKVQIIDWGLAEIDYSLKGLTRKNTNKGTFYWLSPEMIIGDIYYNYKIDIFSLGIIFLQIYQTQSEPSSYHNSYNLYLDRTKDYMEDFLNIDMDDIDIERNFKKLVVSGEPLHKTIFKYILERVNNNEEFADLVSKMLEFNPRHRCTYEDIILHPYFQTLKNRESIPYMKIFINNMPDINNSVNKNNNRKEFLFEFMKIYMERIIIPDENTLCLTIQIYDLYMSINKKIYDPQIMIAVCLLLSSNFSSETNIKQFCKNLNSSRILLDLQNDIINTLEGNLLIPTLYSYISRKGLIYKNEICAPVDAINNVSNSISLKTILGYYFRSDIYKIPFNNINLQNFFTLEFKDFTNLTLSKEEFKLNEGIYVSPDKFVFSQDDFNLIQHSFIYSVSESNQNGFRTFKILNTFVCLKED
jgi:serine/threonine protein kinase